MKKAVLLDIDGVLWWQGSLLPDAAETLLWLQNAGIPYRLLTNRASATAAEMAAELLAAGLAQAGVRLTADMVITPASMARQHMADFGIVNWQVLIPDALASEFSRWQTSDWQQAEGLLLADIGSGWSYETLNRCLQFLLENPQAPWLVLGLTRYYINSEQQAQLDIGAFVKALEYASGRQAEVMGKPAAGFFRLAASSMNGKVEDCLMVGDDWLTDVLAAEAAGIQAVLLRTGKYRPGDELQCPQARVMDALAELRAPGILVTISATDGSSQVESSRYQPGMPLPCVDPE